MNTKLLAEIIGYIAAAMGAGMFMPQVIKCWKTKQTKDISLLTFTFLAIVSLLWVVYGVLISAIPIQLVNFIILILSSVIIYLKLRYK